MAFDGFVTKAIVSELKQILLDAYYGNEVK